MPLHNIYPKSVRLETFVLLWINESRGADMVLCAILNPTCFRPDAVGEKLYSQVFLVTVNVGLGEETGLPATVLPHSISILSSQVLPVTEVSSLKLW